ncbi:unnamed protein product [Vitrella brassicaformis CCMP3155]|uniref:Protein kinase domain-containing protein n=1 Tax=Vitrella brassicaformis (strain CCMP3155) TaxID=1169540 RepID=A0A0G4EU61_VITBC|nr:unnamed protein product [Vitrella brassicaformis CCMP3155]|eukprot:CEM02183.1 unnamed protein product [Vitrella brassicaformis CCMP3155]
MVHHQHLLVRQRPLFVRLQRPPGDPHSARQQPQWSAQPRADRTTATVKEPADSNGRGFVGFLCCRGPHSAAGEREAEVVVLPRGRREEEEEEEWSGDVGCDESDGSHQVPHTSISSRNRTTTTGEGGEEDIGEDIGEEGTIPAVPCSAITSASTKDGADGQVVAKFGPDDMSTRKSPVPDSPPAAGASQRATGPPDSPPHDSSPSDEFTTPPPLLNPIYSGQEAPRLSPLPPTIAPGGRGEFCVVLGQLRRGDGVSSVPAVLKCIEDDMREVGRERALELARALQLEADVLRAAKTAVARVRQLWHDALGSEQPFAEATRVVPELVFEAADVPMLRPVVTEEGERMEGAGMCVVMSKIGDGVSLTEFAARYIPVAPLTNATVAVNTVKAVLALHAAHLTNGDLHGGNTVLANERTGEVGLIDFEAGRNLRHSTHSPLTTRPGPPCTSVGNLEAIVDGRAMRDEAIDYYSDLTAVACSLVRLAFDDATLRRGAYERAGVLVHEVVKKCEDGRITTVEAAKLEYMAAIHKAHAKAVSATQRDKKLTAETRAVSHKTLNLFRDVCVGHAEGAPANQLHQMMADYTEDVTADVIRIARGWPDYLTPPEPTTMEAMLAKLGLKR